MIESLSGAPLSTAISSGLNKFISIFRTPVAQQTFTGGVTNLRSYLSSSRGILIAKKHLGNAQLDLSKGYIFQFNPNSLLDSKTPNYEVRPYAGLDYNDYIWSGGGERKFTFRLFLDDTPGTKTTEFIQGTKDSGAQYLDETVTDNFKFVQTKAYSLTRFSERGILNDVELIQSFTRPDTISGETIPKFSEGGIVTSTQFRPPPRVIFCYGPFYFDGLVTQADLEYTAFDSDLTPLRATIDLTFSVFEFENVTRQIQRVP